MRGNLFASLLILFWYSGGSVLRAEDSIALNFDSLYPRNDYFHVERVLKDLWSDIDLLLQEKDLHERFLYDSDYILDQYLALEKNFEQLVSSNEDFSSYLVEDIEYLGQLVEHLVKKTDAMCAELTGERAQELAHNIYAILERCRQHVVELYEQNREVRS